MFAFYIQYVLTFVYLDTAVDEASEGMPSTYPEVRGTSDITPTANGEENQPHTCASI